MTRKTFETIAKLTLKEVDNQTIVAHAPDLPFLLPGDLSGKPFELGFAFRRSLYLWLLKDPVEVLV